MTFLKKKIENLTAIQLFKAMLFVSVIGITLFCFSEGICGNDFWWHIKVGEWITNHKKIPVTDIFSWYGTSNKIPWTAHEWLSDVVYYLIFKISGSMGIYIVSVALALLMEWLLYRKSREFFDQNVLISGLFFVLYAVVTSIFFYGRPHMISFFLLYFELDCLYSFFDDEKSWKIFLIPVIACIWSNIHGGSSNLSYILCIIFLLCGVLNIKWGCIECIRKSKEYFIKMGCITISSILAILINPIGYKVLAYPYSSMADKFQLSVISEWAPPDAKNIGNLVLFFLPIVLFLLCMFAEKEIIRLIDLIIMGLFVLLFFRSLRFIALWYIVVPFCGFRYLISCRLKEVKKICHKLCIIAFTGVLIIPSIKSISTIKDTYKKGMLISKALDSDMVEVVKRENPQRIYNDYNYGETLIYNDIKVFVDARADLYITDNLLRDAIALMQLTTTDSANLEFNAEDMISKYDFDGFILEKTRPLYTYLRSHQDRYILVAENGKSGYFKTVK